MKTAGTAIRGHLSASSPGLIFPRSDEFVGRNRWYPGVRDLLAWIEKDPALLAERKYISGHFPVVLREHLAGDIRTAVFLREPRKRSISMINHMRRMEVSWRRDAPDIEMLRDETFVGRFIRDYQTKVFAIDRADVSPNRALPPLGDADFERALDRLRRCDFVGITEELPRSMRLLEALTGDDLGGTVAKRGNSRRLGSVLHGLPGVGRYFGSAVSRYATMSPEAQNCLARHLDYDMRLYEEGKRLFHERADNVLGAA